MMSVVDLHTGTVCDVRMRQPIVSGLNDAAILSAAKRLMRDLWLHEFDEHLLVDDQLANDPHARDRS